MAAEVTGRPLGRWHRFLAAALRGFCFGRVRLNGSVPGPSRVPRLIISSHRNGAIDGFQVLRAAPQAQFLVSYQLLRNPVLKLLFTGIPVVRKKDVERYGMDPSAVRSPVEAAAEHMRAGGDLVIFPEGTSRWGHAPQTYRSGAAQIARILTQEGVPFDIIPVGLFYSAPDRFRSVAEVHCGPAVDLPAAEELTESSAWEERAYAVLSRALDEVSVNCADEASFAQVQGAAVGRARSGESFAEAFLQEQAQQSRVPTSQPSGGPVPDAGLPPAAQALRWTGLVLMVILWPVLAAGWFAGTRADARNTVSFFRMMGGLAVALLWLPVLAVAGVLWPTVMLPAAAAAALGWLLLGVRRLRP